MRPFSAESLPRAGIPFLALLLALLVGTANAAPVLRFVPIEEFALPGQDARVRVQIEGLAGTSLASYSMTIAYDPSIVQFDWMNFGDPDPRVGNQLACPGPADTCVFHGALNGFGEFGGEVALFEATLAPRGEVEPFQLPSFTLFTMEFTGLTRGRTGLEIIASSFVDDSLEDLDVSLGTGAIVVPEPSTAFLLLIGSLGLAGLRSPGRRKLA